MDISNIFSSKARKALFRLYFTNPEKEYYLRELERTLDIPVSMIRKELINLKKAGVFNSRKRGNLTYFYVDKTYPLFDELRSIMFKTVGASKAALASRALIFAGANGSGKTTLANTVIEPSMHFINADSIKDRKKLSYINAGKVTLNAVDQYILKRMSFSFETTMSGKGLLKRLERLKAQGFTIIVFYIFAYPIALLNERIEERIKKGGHFVKPGDVARRFYRSTKNFWNTYRQYADQWAMINNNEFHYKNIAIGNKEKFQIIDEFEFDKFKEALGHECAK